MFARVYPVLRLPRRFTFFDYKITPDAPAAVGDLVEIPFKHRKLLGIVKELTETSEYKRVSPITRVVKKTFFSQGDVARIEHLAERLIQSPSSVVDATLQGIDAKNPAEILLPTSTPRSKLTTAVGSEVTDAAKFIRDKQRAFVQLSQEAQWALAYGISTHAEYQTLIVFPRSRDADLFRRAFEFSHAAVLHGKTPLKERATVIHKWRSGEIKTLIGTRQSTLIPANKLSQVVIVDAGSEDHIAVDRNPRFDARLAAELLASQHDSRLTSTGSLPTVRHIATKTPVYWASETDAIFVDLNAQEERSGTAFLSETLQKSVEKALHEGKKVLCSFNRKGVAKRIQCNGCGYIPVCGTCRSVPLVREKDLACPTCATEMWIPQSCPSCKQTRIGKRGWGNKGIAQAFSNAFPSARVGIVDKAEQQEDADILIATEYFFKSIHQPFAKQQFGLVVELAADVALSGDFAAAEKTAYKLHRLLRIARQQNVPCIIQSWLAETTKPMLRPKSFLQQELNVRNRYKLPPSTNRYEITCKKNAETIIPNMLEQTSDQITLLQTTDNTFELITQDMRAAEELLKPLPDACVINPDLISYEHNDRATQPKS